VALLLDALYRPFRDFFLEKFGSTGVSRAHFRFAAVPQAFDDHDFMVEQHPEWGPSPALARERMSRLVDGIPTLELDGRRVTIGPALISELFADELLAPARGRSASAGGDPAQDNEAFDRVKADARKLYESSKSVSVLGDGELRLATAIPERWWDERDPSAWTRQTFAIHDATENVPVKPSAIDTFLGIFREKGKRGTRAGVNTVSITFDFCLVRVDRPWLHRAFLDDASWMIPGTGRGALSTNDGHGLPALPVGFVALRNLRIEAPWTPEDITALEHSVQFGPFNFESNVVDGAITHAGIQVIGWLLEDVSDLPPVDGLPSSRPPVARTSREALGYLDVHRAELVRGPVDVRDLVEHAFVDGPVPAAWWSAAIAGTAPIGERTGMAEDVEPTVIARARRWIDEGDAPGAEVIARALAVMVREGSAVPLLLGDALAKQHRGDEALAAYNTALERAPKDIAALTARGALRLADDKASATADLRAAIALDPTDTNPDVIRARALLHDAGVAPPLPSNVVLTVPLAPSPAAVRFVDAGGLAAAMLEARVMLVAFTASWAGPSRAIEPVLAAVAGAYASRVDVVRVDVDTAAELVAQYQVQAVPTVIVFRTGRAVERVVGAVSRARIEAMIDHAFEPPPPAPLLAGRWSSPLGTLVFQPRGASYTYKELNVLGAVVGNGTATMRDMVVDVTGTNVLAGEFRAHLQLVGDQLEGWAFSPTGQLPLTLSRG